MTTNNRQVSIDQAIQQGRQMSAGLVNGGEMLIDTDSEKGVIRIKLRGIQPTDARPQLTKGLSWMLVNCATMFNLQVMQRNEQTGGK